MEDAEDRKSDLAKVSPSPPPEQITLFIRGQNNSELKFKVKPSTNFRYQTHGAKIKASIRRRYGSSMMVA